MPQRAPTLGLNIAHRGGANLWPENTLYAFAQAIDIGADGIEFDLQLTADHKLAIYHDATLNPDLTRKDGVFVTRPSPRLADLTMAQLAGYDIGRLRPDSPTAKRRPAQQPMDGCQIGEFADLCRLVAEKAGPDFKLYAELKTDMGADDKASEALADHFIAALQDDAIAAPLAGQITLVSFDWRCLTRVLQAMPDLPHAFTTLNFAATDPDHRSAQDDKPGTPAAMARRASADGAPWWGGHDWRHQDGQTHGEKILRAIAAAGGRGWFAAWQDITPETMALAEKLGLAVSAWTVNAPKDMQRLGALGVEALITDRPDLLI
jgi:glycerophosphoryl diester phosphodiesterase